MLLIIVFRGGYNFTHPRLCLQWPHRTKTLPSLAPEVRVAGLLIANQGLTLT